MKQAADVARSAAPRIEIAGFVVRQLSNLRMAGSVVRRHTTIASERRELVVSRPARASAIPAPRLQTGRWPTGQPPS